MPERRCTKDGQAHYLGDGSGLGVGCRKPAQPSYLICTRFCHCWFSWQMNSISSEPSATIRWSILTVKGLVYAFGSSRVNSMSSCPKFTRRNRSVTFAASVYGLPLVIEPSIAAEIIRLDHERVALPSSDGVTVPVRLRLTLRRERPAVGVDRAKAVVRLVDDENLSRRLNDLSAAADPGGIEADLGGGTAHPGCLPSELCGALLLELRRPRLERQPFFESRPGVAERRQRRPPGGLAARSPLSPPISSRCRTNPACHRPFAARAR